MGQANSSATYFPSLSFILPFRIGGLAIFGTIIAAAWFPVAYVLGKRYESVRPAGDSAYMTRISSASESGRAGVTVSGVGRASATDGTLCGQHRSETGGDLRPEMAVGA